MTDAIEQGMYESAMGKAQAYCEELEARIHALHWVVGEKNEAIKSSLPAIDYVADDMPGFDGVPWETVAKEVRCILALTEKDYEPAVRTEVNPPDPKAGDGPEDYKGG